MAWLPVMTYLSPMRIIESLVNLTPCLNCWASIYGRLQFTTGIDTFHYVYGIVANWVTKKIIYSRVTYCKTKLLAMHKDHHGIKWWTYQFNILDSIPSHLVTTSYTCARSASFSLSTKRLPEIYQPPNDQMTTAAHFYRTTMAPRKLYKSKGKKDRQSHINKRPQTQPKIKC